MNNSPFRDYLNLLEQVRTKLACLSELAKQKTAAVRNDDLLALDEVLKQEQAISLSFRSLEKKQASLLAAIGMEGVPLSSIPDGFPPKMRLEAKQVTDSLRTQYQIYQHSAQVARNTLEINLHEIEKILAGISSAAAEGPGYRTGEPEIPPAMKTDFRA